VRTPLARLRIAAAFVGLVVVVGTIGYRIIGLGWIDAAYQTVTTVTTVGYRELKDFSDGEQIFTMVLIIMGVSTVLYTFTLGVQVVVEGQLHEVVGRRRMDSKIARLEGHVVLCGWGRVGQAIADDLVKAGRDVVVVDADAARVADIELPTVVGDATRDETLHTAGLRKAGALVAALSGDAENLFVTLTGRAENPGLFIVARARQDESIAKLTNAGADRVVNPQELGAARMASFVLQPIVAEFVDIVMHERSHEFRMQEVMVPAHSQLAGRSLRAANLRQLGCARPRHPCCRRDVHHQPRSRREHRSRPGDHRRRHRGGPGQADRRRQPMRIDVPTTVVCDTPAEVATLLAATYRAATR
jgi:voltage-gated potassium channel